MIHGRTFLVLEASWLWCHCHVVRIHVDWLL